MGEFLVHHASGLLPKALHQTRLLVGEAIAVPGDGPLKILPCLPQKVGSVAARLARSLSTSSSRMNISLKYDVRM
jgi:hypothetical protein